MSVANKVDFLPTRCALFQYRLPYRTILPTDCTTPDFLFNAIYPILSCYFIVALFSSPTRTTISRQCLLAGGRTL